MKGSRYHSCLLYVSTSLLPELSIGALTSLIITPAPLCLITVKTKQLEKMVKVNGIIRMGFALFTCTNIH